MPRYDYVVQRFKRYDAWIAESQTEQSFTFRPAWSTTRFMYRGGWIIALLLLIGVFVFAYQQFPAVRVELVTLEEFGVLVRQNQAGEIELTGTACPLGIIGEVNSDQIIWVDLGYSGTRWTSTYNLDDSAWADLCSPPVFVQSQRLLLMLSATLILTILYYAANASVTYQHWHNRQAITIQQQGETVIITTDGKEINPATYDQLDTHFDLPTANINMRLVLRAASIFAVIGILLSLIAAYIL